ncbi:hypothetical protein B5M09_005456 [Aphanomyces astaci]|uniref:Signal recognition particle SRP54 subunit M-domain domain-containing protein n=1 Tax=Aphanomyces astaci TaxID=112090 RepID=A0A425DF94_APHAT|nr:hypothetical protein B5M09_005456 [Aphanomyces astaci]
MPCFEDSCDQLLQMMMLKQMLSLQKRQAEQEAVVRSSAVLVACHNQCLQAGLGQLISGLVQRGWDDWENRIHMDELNETAAAAAAIALPAVRSFAVVALRPKPAAEVFHAQTFQVREMSVFSSIKDNISHRLETRKNDKNAQAYVDQINFLANSKTYTLQDHFEQMKKQAEAGGVTGWKSMMPGVSSMPQIQQMKASLQIMEAMEQTHRENPALINGKVKRIVSEKVGQSLEEINNTLRSYEQLNSLRLWLRKRVERGLPLPDSLDNTTEMIREDPTGFPTKNLRY